VHQVFVLEALTMNRFVVAMGTYVVLATLAWIKLTARIPGSHYQVRHVVIVIMAAFALSTWVHRRDRGRSNSESGDEVRSDGTQQ
jgi:hypothetical protein